MDKYTPSEWTKDFVRRNEDFCSSFLRDTKAQVITLLKRGGAENCAAACVGLNQMMSGAATMHQAGIANMRPFLATNSFNCGVILALGCTDVPDRKRRSAAIAAFQDCQDFSNSGLAEYCDEIIDMLQSGVSFSDIKRQTFPDFPRDLIELMQQH